MPGVDPHPTPPPDEHEVHAASVERWRRGRVERLVAPGGWLTLVDRVMLDPGDNDTPIGRVIVTGDRVQLQPRADIPVTVDGAPAGPRELHTEETGALDRVAAGGLVYELSRNAGRYSLRVKDPESEARRNFRGLGFYPVDRAWRLRARLEGAAVHFEIAGRPFSLTPDDPAARRLVFVFGDDTNRIDTYPGGRFLYADPPVAGETVLDFNFAFNPPCAFTPHAICPALAPRNRLPLPVTAGERRYEEV